MNEAARTSDRLANFERERRHLLAVAFRILGADGDAEDAVQEAWIRYARADISQVQNTSAWLTTVVARLCMDSLRRRRDVPEQAQGERAETAGAGEDPEELALLASELTTAFTVVLEELTPSQRVALVLHDAFGTPFEDVAHVLDTTTDSAKKLASRARARIRQRTQATPSDDLEEARRVVEAFLNAARSGDTTRLVALLDQDIVRTADPQVLRPGGAQRIWGVEAVVAEARLFEATSRRARVVSINGRPGIAVMSRTGVQVALLFRVAAGRVVGYDVVADPLRLGQLHIER